VRTRAEVVEVVVDDEVVVDEVIVLDEAEA
jgi:hypothetical protein